MKAKIQLPPWTDQAWFAKQLYPSLKPGTARARLSRKVNGHVGWSRDELDKLGEIFAEIEDSSMTSDEIWKLKEKLFGVDPEE